MSLNHLGGVVTMVVGGTISPTIIVGNVVTFPRHHEDAVADVTVADPFIYVEVASITLPKGVTIPAFEPAGIILAVNANEILYLGPVRC